MGLHGKYRRVVTHLTNWAVICLLLAGPVDALAQVSDRQISDELRQRRAERAARLGMMFFPQTTDPMMAVFYDEEAERVGNPTGLTMGPSQGAPTTVFLAESLDQGWKQFGPYMLHDAVSYRGWMGKNNNSASLSLASSVAELREENGAYRIVTPKQAVELIKTYQTLSLQPLCGGVPPDLAWSSLSLIEKQVLPFC